MNVKFSLFAPLIILLSFVSALAQGPPGSWQRYTVANQEFSVVLPTLPAMTFIPPTKDDPWQITIGAHPDGAIYIVEVHDNMRGQRTLSDFIADVDATRIQLQPLLMKTKLTLISCITILLATTVKTQTGAEPWLRYTVKGEEFSVTLPIEPAMKTSEVFVTRLKTSRLERVIEAKAGELVYRVYVYENPKPRQSLEEFITEQTGHSDLDLTFERELMVGKIAGKQYSSRDRDFPSTEQYFTTEKRCYRFVVRGATADHADARQFFASVLIGKKQDGLEVLEGTSEEGTQHIFV